MAKIKYTKNELKAQRDALARYERFLPTLTLKKQQLQVEVRDLRVKIEEKRQEEEREREALSDWVQLFSEDFDFAPFVRIEQVRLDTANVMGVNVPVFAGVKFEDTTPDYFETPAWVDEGMRVARALIGLRLERKTLEEQREKLEAELRATTQRVNLFEKVMIPQALNNIRMIRIFLGDQQTAAVARAKIAKAKTRERESAT